ncbi:MAG: hypothetical protein PHE60_04805 [Sulfurospirillaceae bacterium]|nr:hypothetical protein [Sulfurospirillaceae bacterium]
MEKYLLFENLEKSISRDRLEHYSKIFSINDKKIIIQKYLLNVALSKSLYFPLQTFETTLRNSIHIALSDKLNNEFWFDDENFLTPRLRAKIDEAKNKIDKSKALTTGRIISELSFGFWTYLLGKEYEQKIWNKYVKLIFPNIPKNMAVRKKLAARINTIRNLRNKIFHFDTIVDIKNLFEIHQEILDFIYWLNKDIYKLTCLFDEFENVYKNEEKIIEIKLNDLSKDN